MPSALRLARRAARAYRVSVREQIEDCEQTACQALLEARRTYDKARGPFSVYAWKRVAGAVMRYLSNELATRLSGFSDALDATEELRDTIDPFADGDDDAFAQLKGHCRHVVFAWFMGDTSAAFAAKPEDTLARSRAFEALSIVFGGLEPHEKQLLDLRYWERLTWEQVAATLRIDERQAKRIDERLRERLKRDLRKRGVVEAPPQASA